MWSLIVLALKAMSTACEGWLWYVHEKSAKTARLAATAPAETTSSKSDEVTERVDASEPVAATEKVAPKLNEEANLAPASKAPAAAAPGKSVESPEKPAATKRKTTPADLEADMRRKIAIVSLIIFMLGALIFTSEVKEVLLPDRGVAKGAAPAPEKAPVMPQQNVNRAALAKENGDAGPAGAEADQEEEPKKKIMD